MSLDEALVQKKESIREFEEITIQILNYLPNVLNKFEIKNDYKLFSSNIAGTIKYIRPINYKLFINDPIEFSEKFIQFKNILSRIYDRNVRFSADDKNIINSTIYTIQQSIGAGLDLLVNPNSARKHVGNRFEELIKSIFSEIGIKNKKLVLKIPYHTEEGEKVYKCENDIILSPFENIKSTPTSIHEREIVVSVKTTSKDRMGKMFIDKMLLEKFVGHSQKVIGIFLNDVQRKENKKISFTLVSGLFMVYTNFLTELEGVYYIDPPPTSLKKPYSNYMKPFSDLITKDVFELLSS